MNYSKVIHLVRSSLKEDIGKRDITTGLFIPKDKMAKAVILAKEDCVVCGMEIAKIVFKATDNKIKFKSSAADGQHIKKGKVMARIQGKARSILIAERTALNFLSHLCGIATLTRRFVQAIKPYRVKIMDTRKTIPNLRALQKYAVRIGGGINHRFKLDEMVLIKDNHLKVIGDRLWVIGFKKIKNKIPTKIKKEVEVKTLQEFKQALKIRADIIMLDNMKLSDIKKAVMIRNCLSPNTYHPTPKLEASGGITLKNIKKVAATGVDMISVGVLTHSAKSIDISLEVL